MNVQRAMMTANPTPEATDSSPRDWYTASELAELALPGLPGDKRSINRRARDERWHLRSDAAGELLARPRSGRGGGIEYHVSLLPGAARLELAARGLSESRPEPVAAPNPAAAAWRWYEAQTAKVKAEAEHRCAILAEIDLLEASGVARGTAVSEVSRRHSIGASTVWNWIKLIKGVAKSDRLPALAPQRRGGGCEAEIDPALWKLFLSDYLRPEKPTLTSCYVRCAAWAEKEGLAMASERTFRRRLDAEIDPRIILLRRQGDEALRRSLPSQRRSVADLHAMALVNIDGHKFDVFVKLPDGSVIRPIMVAIQDIYSRKFLSWRIGTEESAVQARLAFADLFQNYGIPLGCVLDNGRAFASKWITGGAKSRFRFKIRAEEPTGLLTSLGIAIHWALPYRGQSKPIERGFRDLCDSIARGPAMAGAYVGNSPMAKPENYGSRAVAWDEFVAHVEAGMKAHNARIGRRTETARGRSFDETFAESYAVAPIGKATPEQLRMALLAADNKMVNARTGEIELYGNRYWSEACGRLHGQRVTVRFDPDNLMRDIHLYDLAGRYLTSAAIIADTGFLDVAGAKATAKRTAEYRRKIRDAANAEQLLLADQVARMQVDAPDFALPEPAVVRPVRHRGQTAATVKVADLATPKPNESRLFAALGRLSIVK